MIILRALVELPQLTLEELDLTVIVIATDSIYLSHTFSKSIVFRRVWHLAHVISLRFRNYLLDILKRNAMLDQFDKPSIILPTIYLMPSRHIVLSMTSLWPKFSIRLTNRIERSQLLLMISFENVWRKQRFRIHLPTLTIFWNIWWVCCNDSILDNNVVVVCSRRDEIANRGWFRWSKMIHPANLCSKFAFSLS